MDEDYSESVDTSADMDVADTDVAEDIPEDIPEDLPEDIPEEDYSDVDISDDFSEDISADEGEDAAEYDDVDDSVEEDSIEPETEEMDESIDDFNEDSYEDSEISSEGNEEMDDIPEDLDELEEDIGSESAAAEDIPEDIENDEDIVQEDTADDEIPEDVSDSETTGEDTSADAVEQPSDVTNTETTDEATDAEDADAAEESMDMTDTETTDESADPEDIDATEQPTDVTDTETTDETTDAEDADAAEQPTDVTDTETTDEATDAEDADAAEESTDMTDTETTDESVDTEDTDATEQPTDVTDTETTDEVADTEDTNTAEQPTDVTDTETTDEATDAEDTNAAEQPTDVIDTETTTETADIEYADATEQPTDVINTDVAESVVDEEATADTSDVEENEHYEAVPGRHGDFPEEVEPYKAIPNTQRGPDQVPLTDDEHNTEISDDIQDMIDTETTGEMGEKTLPPEDDHSALETYDYESSPEKKDTDDPEKAGEFVSADNPYRERWEGFQEEFSDGQKESEGWDSLKDVPFREEEPTEIEEATEGSDESESATSSEITDNDVEIKSISDYMNAHNYGPDDFATYSQDPQWRQLMRQEYPDYELPEMTQESASAQLSQYMNDHNYGVDDYAEYSKDPIWRELHSTAFPDDELPPSSSDVSEKALEYSDATSDDEGDIVRPASNGGGENNPPYNPDDVTEGEQFGSFKTDKHINGSDSFIKGDNYEQFKKDYYSPEESTYEAYDTPREIDIPPSMIEGIHLGESELENPSVFWSQHEKGGTEESFKEIASRIPDVREQLASGKTMDELLADPELSECAGIYFANKPKVIENDGYYEFDSNGRHRILAARAAGYDIPVEVIGRRSRSDNTEMPGVPTTTDSIKDEDVGFGKVSASEMTEGDVPQSSSLQDAISEDHPGKNRDIVSDSSGFDSIVDSLEAANVTYRPIELSEKPRSNEEIIERISGGDLTEGSCSSLALAYIGNKGGYDVLDFRDGESRSVFSSRSSIQKIANLPDVQSTTISGTDDIENANTLLSSMTPGKEYYLASGQHAAIVRRNENNGFEYLELQHPSNGNGWHNLDNNILTHRFGCSRSHSCDFSNFLMDVDSLAKNKKFLGILGYINTAGTDQRKGVSGNVR